MNDDTPLATAPTSPLPETEGAAAGEGSWADHPPVIEARGLGKRYGTLDAVRGFDMEVRRGEFRGLLGPNGAGKTTVLRMLIGRTPQSAGSLRVLGHELPRQATLMRARMGLVPQHDTLDPDFTVRENLRSYAGYFGLRGPRLERRIEELLRYAALEARAEAPIHTLSGGMQRRLSLARALVNDPALLILDEPTTGLDPQARQLIWQRLRGLKERGITVVLTTHYMEEAERLCDRITVMDHGTVLATDTPEALVRAHIEPHVVEVRGTGAVAFHQGQGGALAGRSEVVGDTVYCYLHEEGPLLGALAARPKLSFLHRPANLEDVFLKLTGRDLRDG